MSSRVSGVMLDRKEVGDSIRFEVRKVFGDNGFKFRQTSPNGAVLKIEVYAAPEDQTPGLIVQSHDLLSPNGAALGRVELYAPGLCYYAMELRSSLSSRMGKMYLLSCVKEDRLDRCSGCSPL